jgi:hypothetical protein
LCLNASQVVSAFAIEHVEPRLLWVKTARAVPLWWSQFEMGSRLVGRRGFAIRCLVLIAAAGLAFVLRWMLQ